MTEDESGTIIICDDHPLVREGLRAIIEAGLSGLVIHEAEDLPGLITLLDHHPDIDCVLLDLMVPGAEGLSGLIAVRERFPSIPVVMISARKEPALIDKSMKLGAAGFLPKGMARDTILTAIRSVIGGDTYLPPGTELSGRDDEALGRYQKLTPQQRRVLDMLADGRLNKQIAYDLSISDSTVKAHVSAILEKLGLATRTQAALFFRQLIERPD